MTNLEIEEALQLLREIEATAVDVEMFATGLDVDCYQACLEHANDIGNHRVAVAIHEHVDEVEELADEAYRLALIAYKFVPVAKAAFAIIGRLAKVVQNEAALPMLEEETTKTPGQMIREARLQKSWTQQELADALAVADRVSIVDWEMDRVVPGRKNVRALSEKLDIPLKKLSRAVITHAKATHNATD